MLAHKLLRVLNLCATHNLRTISIEVGGPILIIHIWTMIQPGNRADRKHTHNDDEMSNDDNESLLFSHTEGRCVPSAD